MRPSTGMPSYFVHIHILFLEKFGEAENSRLELKYKILNCGILATGSRLLEKWGHVLFTLFFL